MWTSLYQAISVWMMDQAFLGHKAPRPGRETLFWCPACVSPVEPGTPLTSRHSEENSCHIISLFPGMFLKTAPQSRGLGWGLGLQSFWRVVCRLYSHRVRKFWFNLRLDVAGKLPTSSMLWVWMSTVPELTAAPTWGEVQVSASWQRTGCRYGRTQTTCDVSDPVRKCVVKNWYLSTN